jgi:hypothetical protein
MLLKQKLLLKTFAQNFAKTFWQIIINNSTGYGQSINITQQQCTSQL